MLKFKGPNIAIGLLMGLVVNRGFFMFGVSDTSSSAVVVGFFFLLSTEPAFLVGLAGLFRLLLFLLIEQ